jgi:hypothetical protein
LRKLDREKKRALIFESSIPLDNHKIWFIIPSQKCASETWSLKEREENCPGFLMRFVKARTVLKRKQSTPSQSHSPSSWDELSWRKGGGDEMKDHNHVLPCGKSSIPVRWREL